MPFVVVETDRAASAWVPTVGCNNRNGGLLAASHLLELGHRRIAIVSGPEDVLCSRARVAGCRFAHDEAEVSVDPSLVRYGNFSADGGYHHGTELLARADPADRDLRGLGHAGAGRPAGDETARAGRAPSAVRGRVRQPADGGVDGSGLTTVNQPLRDTAIAAVRMLLDVARGMELATPRIDLVTELVVRESTAPPPG
jgi:DNA-binding LacI/PurR family transcriptional regulator